MTNAKNSIDVFRLKPPNPFLSYDSIQTFILISLRAISEAEKGHQFFLQHISLHTPIWYLVSGIAELRSPLKGDDNACKS